MKHFIKLGVVSAVATLVTLGGCAGQPRPTAMPGSDSALMKGRHVAKLGGSETMTSQFALFDGGKLDVAVDLQRRFPSTRQSCSQASYFLLGSDRSVMHQVQLPELCMYFSGTEAKRKTHATKQATYSVQIPAQIVGSARYVAVIHHRADENAERILQSRQGTPGLFALPSHTL